MKNLIILTLMVSNFSSFAIGGSLLRGLAKPFTKIGIGSSAEKAVVKSKHIKKFLKTSDVLKSDLDSVKVVTVLPDFPGAILESNYEKISELEFLGYDLKNKIKDFIENNKNASTAEVTLLIREIEDFNFLLASVSVTLAKDFNKSDVSDVLHVISDIANLSSFNVSGSYRVVSAFMDLNDVLLKCSKDLVRGIK